MPDLIRFYLPDPAATHAFGCALGETASDGDVVAALGDLGAGKTCLAQGLAEALGIAPSRVNSPTFAILQSYSGRLMFHHVDLYRISDEDEALGLGLDELIGVHGVSLVEWPTRLSSLIPRDALWIRLEPENEGRVISLLGVGQGQRWLDALLQHLPSSCEPLPAS